MRARVLVPVAAVTAAAVLLATGCNKDSEGEANPAAATSTIAAAPGDLDPGEYRTTAQPAFGDAGSDNMGRIVEGQRLAEFVTLPGEVDPDLTELASMSTNIIKNPAALSRLFLENTVAAGERNGMIVGFTTSRHSAGNVTQDRSLVHAVLRFPDAASAQKAAQEMHQASLNEPEAGSPRTETAIDILPNTYVSTGGYGDRTNTHAFTAHGDYVVYEWVESLATEQDWQPKTIAKAVELQIPLIDQFPATPVDQLASLPIDIDSVLVYTVAPLDSEDRTVRDLAVYGPRGASHFSTDDMLSMKDFADTGMTNMAVDATNVYKFETAEGAQELFARFLSETDEGVGTDGVLAEPWTRTDGPAGVPNSQCWTGKTFSDDAVFYCIVLHGDKIGETSGMDETDVKQQLTAQYMILDPEAQK